MSEDKKTFRVMKGSRKKPILDSTHADRSKANDRCETLRKSYLGGKGRNRKMEVWMEEGEPGDLPGYRKPIKGPYTNYNSPQPRRTNGRRA